MYTRFTRRENPYSYLKRLNKAVGTLVNRQTDRQTYFKEGKTDRQAGRRGGMYADT